MKGRINPFVCPRPEANNGSQLTTALQHNRVLQLIDEHLHLRARMRLSVTSKHHYSLFGGAIRRNQYSVLRFMDALAAQNSEAQLKDDIRRFNALEANIIFATGMLEKCEALIVMMNSGSLHHVLEAYRPKDAPYIVHNRIIPLYARYFLANHSAAAANAFVMAMENGGAKQDGDILHLCAFSCEGTIFTNIAGYLGFSVVSNEYVDFLTTQLALPLFPLAPIYIAAFSNNVASAYNIAKLFDLKRVGFLFHDEEFGLSLMHYARWSNRCDGVL